MKKRIHIQGLRITTKDPFIFLRILISTVMAFALFILSFILIQKSQSMHWIAILLSAMVALILAVFVIYIEIKKNRNRKKVFRLAYIDELTGIANKNSFLISAGNLLKQRKSVYAMVILDIDKFKLVNDLFDYSQGDKLLNFVAESLVRHLAPNETCCRISGDRFGLLMSCRSISEFEHRLNGLLERLASFKFPANSHFNLNFCAGIYVINDLATTIETAFDRAGLALGRTKSARRYGYSYYDEAFRNQLVEDNEIENDLRDALKNNEYEVYLQPKYTLKTGGLTGAEALIRWLHPVKGPIQPAKFIPILERTGLIAEMDQFVLAEVCRTMRDWRTQGKDLPIISINQSKILLHNPGYVQTLIDITGAFEINPNRIEIELTERAFFSDIEVLSQVTTALRQKGFRISIDDFGTGYSSLNLLQAIEIDVIKLDGSFLKAITTNNRSRKIVESIVNLSRDLGIVTVAEGIETEEQASFLRTIGCNLGQGYFFREPVPIPQFEELLDQEIQNAPDS